MFSHNPPQAPGGSGGSRSGTLPVSQLGAPIKLYELSQSLAASQAQTLAPVSPSPIGQLAPCGQVGYEVSFQLLAAAGTGLTPFMQALLNFYDDDSLTAQPVAPPVTWYLPVGFGAGATPTNIAGTGPLRGQYMSVQLTNLDSLVGLTAGVRIRGVSRSYGRDDWRWGGGGQVPGFLPATSPAGQNTLLLASVSQAVNAGVVKPLLLPLFAGRVRMRAAVTGLTANNAVITILPLNSVNPAGTVIFLSPGMGNTLQELSPQPEISLPRDMCQLVLNNATGAQQATFTVTLTAEEY